MNHLPTFTRRGVAFAAAAALLAIPLFAQAQNKVTLTFAGATFAESGRGDKLKAWVEKFNNSQSAIEVQPVALPFSTLAKTVFTQMGGGAGPDLVRFDLIDFYAAVQAQRVLPLDEAIKESDYKFSGPNRYMTVGGKRYGVPFEISNYSLLYNPQLLKGGKPPANFDEFLAAAKAATGNGVFGFAYRATMAESAGFWQDLCNFVYGFDGRWSDGKGNLTINSAKVVQGVAAYKKMYDLGAAAPAGAGLPGAVTLVEHVGAESIITVRLDSARSAHDRDGGSAEEIMVTETGCSDLRAGDRVSVQADLEQTVVFAADTGQRISNDLPLTAAAPAHLH